jgi:Predicted transcriptional regulator
MSRSLSKRESEVVLELEWSGRRCVTIKDVSSLLNCSYDYAKKIAQRLVEKRWFEPIGKGRYLLIGASSGKEGIPNANALLTGSFLVNPYYFLIAPQMHFMASQPRCPPPST